MGPDRRRHVAPVTFDTREDAEAWLAGVQTDVAREEWHRPAPDRPAMDLFESYADSWLATRELTPRTRAEYRKLIDGHLVPAFGSLHLDDITRVMVRDWFATLSTTTGPTRRAHAYGLMRTIMGTAVTDDLIPANPCRLRGAGQTKRARTIRPATLGELDVIAEKIRPEYSAAVLLAAWCGLRFGEVAELRRKDVDVKAGVLHIRRAVTHVDGQPIVGAPKSAAGIRDVAIPPHLLHAIVAHLRTHTALSRDALLFPAPSGGQLRGDGALHESFHAARLAAGRPDLRFHDLRHTGATLAATTGATLAELMRRLGHSTPVAAMRYQHAVDDRDAAIAAALSDFASAGGLVQLHPRKQADA